jgi:hypothetical protein
MTMPIISSSDGPRVSVNDLAKSPTVIPRRIINLTKNQFIADAILRKGDAVPSGIAQFYESTPLFADTGASIRSEFAEYRIVTTSEGIPRVSVSVDRGLSLMISDEMRSRNQMDRVNLQVTQIKNTLVRDWDTAFITALLANPSVQTGSGGAWSNVATTSLRTDILGAVKAVNNATTGNQAQNFLAFNCDTMVINENVKYFIMTNTSFNSGTNIYQGNLADENLQYTGVLPQKLLNLNVLVMKAGGALPDTKVLFLERGTVGFISDEEPLQATPLYRDNPRRTVRSDVNRKSLMGIDQPKAALVLTIT